MLYSIFGKLTCKYLRKSSNLATFVANDKLIEMKYSEIERKLKKAGCIWVKDGKKHPIWYSPITD